MPNLQKLYNNIENSQKNDFLWEILQQDERIERMFVEKFFQEWEAIRLNEPQKYDLKKLLKMIKEDALTISAELSELNFEDVDWDLWDDPGYYVPDYEVAQSIAEDMADQAVEGLLDKLQHEIEFGDLTAIVSNLAATLHGFSMAEIYDPHDNLSDDPNDYFFDKVVTLLRKDKTRLASRKFLPDDFSNALDLFFQYLQRENCEGELFPSFADFFIPVIQNKEQAQVFWHKANHYHNSLSEYPTLINHVISLLGDKQLWVKTMEGIFLQDYESSEDLMNYYFESNPEMFNEKVAEFFHRYKHESYDFLSGKVEKGSPIHLVILNYGTINLNSLNAFIELKSYITLKEIEKLIDSLSDSAFKIKLWNQEKRFDQIEEILTMELKNGTYYDRVDFAKSIKYLYKTSPDAAIRLTEEKIRLLMKTDRTRTTYQYIAKLLKQSLAIPGKQEQVKSIALGLYHHKPNLPALKDELRKADLI